ncbi:MAG: 3-hydroxyacyl-[acp] dehydratase [Pseudomonadota bacterium]
MDINEISKILPHKYPLLLVDRVVAIEHNKSIEAYKNVSIGEQVFQGHFPNHPIYPGVYIIEGLAQAGGILAFESGKAAGDPYDNKLVYFMSIDGAKFRQPVKPGDRLDYKLTVLKHKGYVWVLKGEAFVDGKLVCEAELKAMVMDR